MRPKTWERIILSQTTEARMPLITRSSRAPAQVGLPPSTFFHLAKNDPTFPKKLRFGPQMTGYLTAELVAWALSKREVA